MHGDPWLIVRWLLLATRKVLLHAAHRWHQRRHVMSALIRANIIRTQHAFHLRLCRMLSTWWLIRVSVTRWVVLLRWRNYLFFMVWIVSWTLENLRTLHVIIIVIRVDFLRRVRGEDLRLLGYLLLRVIRRERTVVVAFFAVDLIRFRFFRFFWDDFLFVIGFRQVFIQPFQSVER